MSITNSGTLDFDERESYSGRANNQIMTGRKSIGIPIDAASSSIPFIELRSEFYSKRIFSYELFWRRRYKTEYDTEFIYATLNPGENRPVADSSLWKRGRYQFVLTQDKPSVIESESSKFIEVFFWGKYHLSFWESLQYREKVELSIFKCAYSYTI